MALPADGQNANDLTKVTEIPAGKELIFFDPTTNEGGIITLENLTKQILNGLTSQTFALDAGQRTIPAALNYLYGNISNIISINGDNYGFVYQKVGKIVQVHGSISAKATSITQKLDLPDPLNNISSQITFMGRSNSNGTIVRFRFNQQKELSSIDSTTENHLYIMDFSYLSK